MLECEPVDATPKPKALSSSVNKGRRASDTLNVAGPPSAVVQDLLLGCRARLARQGRDRGAKEARHSSERLECGFPASVCACAHAKL